MGESQVWVRGVRGVRCSATLGLSLSTPAKQEISCGGHEKVSYELQKGKLRGKTVSYEVKTSELRGKNQ